MRYTVDSEEFDSIWYYLMTLLAGTGVSLILYGVYVNLFLLALHTLSRRRKAPGVRLLIIATWAMAVLGTFQMAINIALTLMDARFLQNVVHAQVWDPRLSIILTILQHGSMALNNFVTDSFFLYRCYVIWGFQRKIVILPALLMLSTVVVGGMAVDVIDGGTLTTQMPYILAAVTNSVLTTLTAGRIIWIRRQAAHVGLETVVCSRYNKVIKIILESGAIYCAMAICLASLNRIYGDIFQIMFAVSSQLINIIPTLTLVYIGLTNTAENPLSHSGTRPVRSDQTLPPPGLGPLQQYKPSEVLYITSQENDTERV